MSRLLQQTSWIYVEKEMPRSEAMMPGSDPQGHEVGLDDVTRFGGRLFLPLFR